jgi:hypothetical protein
MIIAKVKYERNNRGSVTKIVEAYKFEDIADFNNKFNTGENSLIDFTLIDTDKLGYFIESKPKN